MLGAWVGEIAIEYIRSVSFALVRKSIQWYGINIYVRMNGMAWQTAQTERCAHTDADSSGEKDMKTLGVGRGTELALGLDHACESTKFHYAWCSTLLLSLSLSLTD